MRISHLSVSAAAIALPIAAHAATLRPFTETTAATVRLTDLFDDLGATPDRVLGRGPAPGERIVVSAPQLAAIARDFNVDWRPSTGAEQAEVARRGDTLPRAVILAAVRQALRAAGAPDGSDIVMPDAQPMVIPAGSHPIPDISQCSYDPTAGRFTALVSVSTPDMPSMQQRISGAVVVLTAAIVPTHRLPRGSVIAAADVQPMRVRVNLLHGNTAIQPEQAEGMVLKHDVAAGQPLTSLDVARPDLVLRGSLVHMTLSSAGIALAAEGIAKDSGAQGDRIRVENPTSHAIVQAEVIGPESVRVAPQRAIVALVSAQ
jgi:flagella basal body P-ring formation protein FlgA